MIYFLESKRAKRKLIRFILFVLGLIFIALSFFIEWFFGILGLYLMLMIFFIKDIDLNIYEDRIELKYKSIWYILTTKEIFWYKDIKRIKVEKAFTNIMGALFDTNAWFYNGANSSTDTIELIFEDDTFRLINRIGNKEDFFKACEFIIIELIKIKRNKIAN